MQVLDCLQNIGAKALFIGKPRTFFKNAALNAAAQVFDEIAVKLRIDFANGAGGIEFDASGLSAGLSSLKQSGRSGKQAGEVAAGNGHSKRLHYSKRGARPMSTLISRGASGAIAGRRK